MRLNKDSAYGFLVCAALCVTSFAIGANFQDDPGREYFDACLAFQAEETASQYYSAEPFGERHTKHRVRLMHWLAVMEKFEPNNAAVKKQMDVLNQARKQMQRK